MASLWFWIVAAMIATYVVLDGFDLGAGAIYLFAAKTNDERRRVLRAIGPVWDGNEVWLLAAGGTLYFAFPQLYASSFSGFYLPLMVVLWLLMLRAIGIEFRAHIETPVWQDFFDVVFSVSSILLAVFFGAALGNVVRGVPLDASGYFFEPLWTNFKLSPQTGHSGLVHDTHRRDGASYPDRARFLLRRSQNRRRPRPPRPRFRLALLAAAVFSDFQLAGCDLFHPARNHGELREAQDRNTGSDRRCCQPGSDALGQSQGQRETRVRCLQPVYRLHAGGRGVCALSRGAACAQPPNTTSPSTTPPPAVTD